MLRHSQSLGKCGDCQTPAHGGNLSILIAAPAPRQGPHSISLGDPSPEQVRFRLAVVCFGTPSAMRIREHHAPPMPRGSKQYRLNGLIQTSGVSPARRPRRTDPDSRRLSSAPERHLPPPASPKSVVVIAAPGHQQYVSDEGSE